MSKRSLIPALQKYFITAHHRFLIAINAQYSRFFLWIPVFLACGIGIYFSLWFEPRLWLFGGVLCLAGILLFLTRRFEKSYRAIIMVFLLISLGFLLAGMRANVVSAPVLKYRFYGAIEGRILKVDRSASQALRLTLDQVSLAGVGQAATPERVRLSLHAQQEFITAKPGMRIMATGHLSPPPNPAEPGGFDFRRMAWFDKLGAVGYTRIPILRAEEDKTSLSLFMNALRFNWSQSIQSQIEGQAGGFSAAILTGDRAGISEQTSENLRRSNLSHLLAISGLHMGLFTAAVFAALRFVLIMVVPPSNRHLNKKLAAIGAMLFGFVYLMLSGWSVSTERAYIMVFIMFLAVLMDRRALSLRSVALAALIILFIQPEVLTEAGFQMSFAATTSLVAVFSMVREGQFLLRWPWLLRAVFTVVLSSAVAGIATAPIAAAHFNRISDYGLIANILAVPVMGTIVMPSAIVAIVLTPLGLEWIGFWGMEKGVAWILWVSETVSAWDGAARSIMAPSALTLPLLAFGGIFLILWRGRAQYLGVLPLLAGFMFWGSADRPLVLVSERGDLVGVMTEEGRALNKPRGSGFIAQSWLENDGDHHGQVVAAQRQNDIKKIGDLSFTHITGRGWQDRLMEACKEFDLVIVNQKIEGDVAGGCQLYDANKLQTTGALAVYEVDNDVVVKTVHTQGQQRLWSLP